MPTKQQQGSCAAATTTASAPEMLVLNLSTQSGLNLTRHSEQPATAEEDEEDPMDYMMGLDLAVNGHGFEATIGKMIEFRRLLFNQNKW